MAAIVKPIEAKSVHLIQSGQVIVDLCSVVKELVENSLDAGANNVEVRFKNNGLDEIEVQDNGAGIANVNFDSVALKHHTSKLSTYDDLSSLQTFGFRGEALSSLCALSTFYITTAQAHEAPKGHRLDFEISGKLKDTTVVACQKGTIATVQNLFEKLPVRRKELGKNIKREYGKVLGLLHAYACISTNVKFTVKNAMPKGKSMTVFATKANTTTRENIANIYGAKTLTALVALDLDLDYQQSSKVSKSSEPDLSQVLVRGHISKPVFGEGRQTPDRQMFFVNGRPCGLPQIAKAINEVYKSFNISQSPFIVADFQLDTNSYDVNVSPDKRTIFLHNAESMIESLKTSLTELFDQQDQTVPNSNTRTPRLPAFKQLNFSREATLESLSRSPSNEPSNVQIRNARKELETVLSSDDEDDGTSNRLLHDHFRDIASTRESPTELKGEKEIEKAKRERERRASKVANLVANQSTGSGDVDEFDDLHRTDHNESIINSDDQLPNIRNVHVRDFNARMAEQQRPGRHHAEAVEERQGTNLEPRIPSLASYRQSEGPAPVQNAFNRMRPRRPQPEVATITIGDRTITTMIGSRDADPVDTKSSQKSSDSGLNSQLGPSGAFSQGLQRFNAPGTQSAVSTTPQRDDLEAETSEETHPAQSPLTATTSGANTPHQDLISDVTEAYQQPRNRSMEPNLDQIGENVDKTAEEDRVNELIRLAEDSAQQHGQGDKRAAQLLKSTKARDSVCQLEVEVEFDQHEAEYIGQLYKNHNYRAMNDVVAFSGAEHETEDTAEERLSLTVSKSDFLTMHIVGQFNLGFIIAVRHKSHNPQKELSSDRDEMFIIDQHASDEKYNFERLQAETVVGNQRMVRPAVLELTAVEEEVVIENRTALEKNGFIVEVDTSGEQEIGSRCQLVSLPLSKEVVFGTKDLDELIHLLAESPMLSESQYVPRPSKVRKMFAMRACRSSIMIGKTLSRKQMRMILQHMGTIDKPWNCPHGRPTMRHLASLDAVEKSLWKEGDGVYPGGGSSTAGSKSASQIWKSYSIE